MNNKKIKFALDGDPPYENYVPRQEPDEFYAFKESLRSGRPSVEVQFNVEEEF